MVVDTLEEKARKQDDMINALKKEFNRLNMKLVEAEGVLQREHIMDAGANTAVYCPRTRPNVTAAGVSEQVLLGSAFEALTKNTDSTLREILPTQIHADASGLVRTANILAALQNLQLSAFCSDYGKRLAKTWILPSRFSAFTKRGKVSVRDLCT